MGLLYFMEVWKDINGYEGLYQVSNLGNVKSLKYGKERILKPDVSKFGYLFVDLCKNNICKSFRVHRLVAIVFIPNLENKEQVNHINGIKTDNMVQNLEWVTAKENIQHAYDNGLKYAQKGEKHINSKLTNEQVLSIKKDNRTQKEIAKDYNVSFQQISRIKRGERWNHLIN